MHSGSGAVWQMDVNSPKLDMLGEDDPVSTTPGSRFVFFSETA
jgi:hypothetical protein